MHSQTAEHWERKAVQARHAAGILTGRNLKAAMLEIAEHYEKLANQARMLAAKCSRPKDTPK